MKERRKAASSAVIDPESATEWVAVCGDNRDRVQRHQVVRAAGRDFSARAAITLAVAASILITAACGGSQSLAPHYVITSTYWSGACEFVSTVDQDGTPVQFERCLAVAEVRNDGGPSQDPVIEELALVRGYDIHGLLLPERCDGATEPVVPKMDQRETGRISCHLIVIAPDQFDTSRQPVITIQNTAEQVQNSGG